MQWFVKIEGFLQHPLAARDLTVEDTVEEKTRSTGSPA